jgi:alpha-tubulin suppressor-like RCC1 family protein
MTNFISGNAGVLLDIYLSETELIDRFVGNRLFSWGTNTSGTVGDNTVVSRSSPVQTISGGTNWTQVSASMGSNTFGIKTDGTLWGWGSGSAGQLGNNSVINRSSPVQIAGNNWSKMPSRVGIHFGAIKTDGTLWMWGSGGSGSIGDNSIISKSSPVQIAGTNWKQIEVSDYAGGTYQIRYSAALKTDNTLWAWGENSLGSLGDNTNISRSSPVQIAGTDWKKISVGAVQTGAIKTDGTLWIWGHNNVGQLGDNSIISRSSPVQIAGTNWKQINCGFTTSAAIKTDGTLWIWGSALSGRLGDNQNTERRSSPVQTVSGGSNWKQVQCGSTPGATFAIKTDGTLWTWGPATNGDLGDNANISRSSPVQIAGTNWKQVSDCSAVTFAD